MPESPGLRLHGLDACIQGYADIGRASLHEQVGRIVNAGGDCGSTKCVAIDFQAS